MKIDKYKTVSADNLRTLDELINASIAEGFQPYGSPYYTGSTTGDIKARGDDSWFCQAMVRSVPEISP